MNGLQHVYCKPFICLFFIIEQALVALWHGVDHFHHGFVAEHGTAQALQVFGAGKEGGAVHGKMVGWTCLYALQARLVADAAKVVVVAVGDEGVARHAPALILADASPCEPHVGEEWVVVATLHEALGYGHDPFVVGYGVFVVGPEEEE